MSKTPTNPSIITRDVDKIAAKTGNVYESITIVGQRARQISSKMKEELSGKLSEFASSVDNLEDKLNRLYTFYKKVWVPSGINAFQVLDLRFNHQVVALKKGMQPIQYAPDAINFIKLGSIADSVFVTDTTKLAKSLPIKDTVVKADSVVAKKTAIVKPIAKVVAPQKVAQQTPKKTTKQTPKKSNNKTNNKSLKDKKKTVKAVMPKKPASNNN